MRFEYSAIETQVVDVLPEIRPAAERYWADEGAPGEDSGAYIFFGSVVTPYIEVLLAMPEGGGRDHLLARAYGLIEPMLVSAQDVRDLAYIEVLEWMAPWWYARSRPFLGPHAVAELDRWEAGWRSRSSAHADADPDREIIDLYGVRELVAGNLTGEGVGLPQVPGITAPRPWQRLAGIEAARAFPDAVALVSCFGTSWPYVLCTASEVDCGESSLERLARDLADLEHKEPNQAEKAQAGFYRIAQDERVWNMTDAAGRKHSRWTGSLWITAPFVDREDAIRDVLLGRSPALKS